MRWLIVCILGISIGLAAWLSRYQMVSVSGQVPGIYVMNRWTGEMNYCLIAKCGLIELASK